MSDLGKFEKNLARTMRNAQQRALRLAGREIKALLVAASQGINDLGAFKNGWYTTAIFDRMEVGNTAPHAVFVENGRRPGARPPPVAAIMPWVMRHIGDPRAAFPIARNIGIRGIQARPVLGPNLARIGTLFREAMEACLAEATQEAVP